MQSVDLLDCHPASDRQSDSCCTSRQSEASVPRDDRALCTHPAPVQNPAADLKSSSVYLNIQPAASSPASDMPADVPVIRTEEELLPATDDALFDPWCDPKNPRMVQFQDISAAAFKIKSGVMMTPCTRSHLSNLTGCKIFFKKDFLQYTGSFKVSVSLISDNLSASVSYQIYF